jgi:integrase
MPAGTPPKKVVAAVRDFAREEFGRRHRYAMVLHTDEPHPHVHVVVKAVSEAGVRLNISRETLQHWRREFARQLRAQGVEANATERRVRGQSRTSKLDSIFRAAQRGESSHMATRVRDVVRELKAGSLDQSCNMVFDDFMAHCESRMSKSDLSFAALESYRKILKSTWRPEIGEEFFEDVKYSRLAKIVDGKKGIGKKTYNNIVSVIRCAFEYGYRDNPEKHNPAAALKCFRLTKKDRPPPDPFSIHEAEALIAAIHLDWGEAQGNYDEFRFFTGLRPSEQIALLIDDCDTSQGKLKVSKARVMKRDKDRTKTGEDGTPISDLNHPYDRWRWTLLMTLKARYREAYNARHSFVSWNLMLGKNLLWVAKQMATACRQCWRSTASGLKAHSKPISKLFVVRWKRAREELPSLPFFVTPRVPESPQNLAVVWQ